MRYKSCLWWKYAMEQYGTTVGEPWLGIDFVYQVYQQNSAGYSGIGAVNRALNVLGAGTSFDQAFKQFAVANWTKDLTGVPDASYNYIDEDEAGNPGPYGPLTPNAGGTIQVGTPARGPTQWTDRYGIRYYEADIGATCPVVSASFVHDDGPSFYHVVTQNGTAFNTHVQGGGGGLDPGLPERRHDQGGGHCRQPGQFQPGGHHPRLRRSRPGDQDAQQRRRGPRPAR